ncbi:MAG: hypothetical protein KAJ19_26240 [Gammaproteobacteria bacterium]|nr:hypothetical protein [Gammaproteobacteria bacterium]
MSELWRVKKYYSKRVLVDTERVLDSSFDAVLICLEGPELEMLRNMTQYLHRRSTFAQEYTDVGYLAPSIEDWDTISSIVADIERKLMGCEEFTTLLESILAQLVCVCDKTTASLDNDVSTPTYSPATQNIIENYFDTEGLQDEDDYADDVAASGDRCPVAQLMFWQAWEFTNEIMQPVASETIDILLPAAMVALAVMCGTLALAIPVGVLLALLWKLIEIDVAGSMQDVQNAMWANKDELVCAVWDGLGVDYYTAELRARDVIDGMDGLSALDKVALRLLYSPWAIGLVAKAWDNQTAWALANVSSGACDLCAWSSLTTWNFPPCPGTATGSFSCTAAGHPGIKQDTDLMTDTFVVQDIGSDVDATISATWLSAHPSGWTVGYVWLQYQDVGLAWHNLGAITLTNNAGIGNENDIESTIEGVTIPRNVLRLRVNGQAGQGQTDPYPVEVVTLSVRIVVE